MTSEYPFIARQGWPLILVCVAAALVLYYMVGTAWSLPAWLLAVLVAYLYRDPERDVPPSPLGLVSPADGCVTHVVEDHDPHLDREAVRISIHMDPLGSYTLRIPTEGKVMKIWFPSQEEGEEGLARESSSSGGAIERYAIWVRTDEGDDAVMVIRLYRWSIRPQCYIHIGQRIGQGQRCGIIGLGGAIDVFVPADARIDVQEGDKVRAGSDIIATFTRQTQERAAGSD